MFRVNVRSRSAAALLALGSLALLSACSSSASNSASTDDHSGSSSSSPSTAAGVAAAKAYAAPYLAAPKNIELSTPLKAKPPAGKLLVKLIYPTPTEEAASRYTAQAAALIGWKYKPIVIAPTPEGIQQAFTSALQLNPAPNVIEEAGYDQATFAAQLAAAHHQGIGVISESATAPASPADGIIANLNGPPAAFADGKMLAAYVIAESNGNVHAASFNIDSITVINHFVSGFQAGLKQWCPSCTDTVVPELETGVGTTIPQSVVSTLQKNPSINYAVFSFGDMTIGVDQALRAAGLASQAKIVGQTADVTNIQAIKAGTEDAFVSFNNPILGYRTVDTAARFVEGMPEPSSTISPLPEQIITKSNVSSILADSSGQYYGVTNYQSQFEALWHLGQP
jgi:ribose transport system substrate-binding protein